MAKKARVSVNPDFRIGTISKRIYGAFMEPIGSIVYGNMYNPKHPTADEQGFRTDWIEALKKADV
ncbi:MAG: alpha-L-arabinofuranosidase, partial [Lachnospiraceae bacterium]|nr:alpha-L-arabinofuranosidase [Lachnospiraceae bacterium]